MSMGGWDLVSLVDVALINERLREAAGDVVQRFQYKEENLRIRGVFGPWQIVPGGSRQKLHVDLPLKSGELRLHPGMQTRYPLKGLVLRVELALRIIEPTQEAGPRNLMFNLDRTGLMGAEQPVTVVELFDPEGRIPEDDKRILSISLAACLKKHQDKIKFVFASVTSTAGLSMPNLDWAYLETGGAGQYLAIAGALDPMPADLEADSIGDGLILPDMQGALGLSGRTLCQKVIAPSMNQTFKPQNSFVGQGSGVRLLRPVRLAPQKIDGYVLQPVLHKLEMKRIETGFDVSVHAITAIKGDTIRLETCLLYTSDAADD